MSNLLKSKFLLGAMVVAVMFVAVASATPASADCSVTPTVKVGSKGASVQCVQTKLGLTADGSFGPMTNAAVKSFQASKGLTADGVVGPMTAAAMNGAAPVVSGNFPAGCSSASGFSTTTGQPCNSASTLPAGCSSTSGYSSTTGAKCDGAATTPTSSGPLAGGAGDITVSSTSTDVETEVAEGSTKNVLGFKVEATDSDAEVTSVKLTFENNDSAGSYRLSDYVDSVDVYMGSTKVGSADVADFTKNTAGNSACDNTGGNPDDSNCYTKSIALSNAIVREGTNKKQTFYVKVHVVSNLDSGDVGNNSWDVLANGIRFMDSTGMTLTSPDDASNTFDVTDLAGFGDVKLTISKGSASPVAGNIEVSDTSSTPDVLLLEFKLKAAGSDMTFDELTVALDGTVAGANNLQDMISNLELRKGSTVLASDGTVPNADDGDAVFTLDDLYTIAEGSTDTFRVYAKIADISNFGEGDSVVASLAQAGIAAEDVNGDVVTNETGSATGETQTFLSSGALVSYVSESFTADNVTDSVDGTISMKFKVTAFGDNDIVLSEDQFGSAKTTGLASQAAGAGVVVFTVTGETTSDAVLSSSDLTASGGEFTISAGDSATFTLSVKTAFGTNSGFVKLAITNVDDTTVSNVVQTANH